MVHSVWAKRRKFIHQIGGVYCNHYGSKCEASPFTYNSVRSTKFLQEKSQLRVKKGVALIGLMKGLGSFLAL